MREAAMQSKAVNHAKNYRGYDLDGPSFRFGPQQNMNVGNHGHSSGRVMPQPERSPLSFENPTKRFCSFGSKCLNLPMVT